MLPYVDYVFASSEEGRCLVDKEKDYDTALAIAKRSAAGRLFIRQTAVFISDGRIKTLKVIK